MCNKNKILKQFRNKNKEITDVLKALIKEHKQSPYTVKNQTKNKSKVCFIFSCPGKAELLSNKLCNGATGDNLNKLLTILNKKSQDIFVSTCKDKYDILNTTSIVHFYALDKKTEGTKEEIENNKQNLQNYCKNNKNLKYVILMGNKAKTIDEVFKNKVIIKSRHLSYHSINHIHTDIHGNSIDEKEYPEPYNRTVARLEVIADEIIKEIK